MLEIVTKVKRWLNPPGSKTSEPVLFAVPCACGQVVEGERQTVHQLALCPKCGEKVFIFPKSPLPPLLSSHGQGGARPTASRAFRRRKAALAASLVILAGMAAWAVLANQNPEAERHSSPPSVPLANRVTTARVEMGQGKFYTALEHLDAARQSEEYEELPGPRRRGLDHLRLQASLLADLTEVPLSRIVRRAGDLPQGEWEKVFAHRYRGTAVLFDAHVERDARDRLRFDFRIFANGPDARVEIADLDILKGLSIDRPVRVIFGARLAGISRDRKDALVVHLAPKSGVLLTERSALEAAVPALHDDPEVAQVLKRQQDFLNRTP